MWGGGSREHGIPNFLKRSFFVGLTKEAECGASAKASMKIYAYA